MAYGDLPEQDGVRGFRFSIPEPVKDVVLRLPTPAEYARYSEAYRNRASRATGPTSTSYRPDLDLFRKLKVSGPDCDEYEARLIIAKLTEATITACERVDGQFRITLTTPFGATTHTLRTPTAKQLLTSVHSGQRGSKLYDDVVESSEGYAVGTEVPVHHRQLVAAHVVMEIDQVYEGGLDPNPPSPSTGTASESEG